MLLEIKQFDDSQTVLLRPVGDGKKQLVATLTGDKRSDDARCFATAGDLRKAVAELLIEIDDMNGVAQVPYRNAVRLGTAVSRVKELLEASVLCELANDGPIHGATGENL